jgi:hypothetical protein
MPLLRLKIEVKGTLGGAVSRQAAAGVKGNFCW